MSTKRKVVALVRVSSEDQGEADRTGLDRQRDQINDICEEHNLECVREYPIVGLSGSDVQRSTRFSEMLRHLAKHEINGVVLATLDRFMRLSDITATEVFKPFVGAGDGKRIFCNLGELNPKNQKDIDVIWGEIRAAGRERERIRERTLYGRQKNRKKPDHKVDRTPFYVGWDKASRTFFWKRPPHHPTDETRRIIRAFELADSGMNYSEIARTLGFHHRHGLRYILRSQWVLGIKSQTHQRINRVWDATRDRWTSGKRVKVENPIHTPTNLASDPLISRELFDRVQARLDNPKPTYVQRQTRQSMFLGAGLYHCAKCGSKMYHQASTTTGKPYQYLCGSYYSTKVDYCQTTYRDVKQLDRDVWVRFLLSTKSVDAVKRHMKTAGAEVQDAEIRRKELETRLNTLQRQQSRVLDLLLDSDDDVLKDKYKSISAEIKSVQNDLTASTSVQTLRPEQIVNLVKDVRDMDVPERRELMMKVISRVWLYQQMDEDVEIRFEFR